MFTAPGILFHRVVLLTGSHNRFLLFDRPIEFGDKGTVLLQMDGRNALAGRLFKTRQILLVILLQLRQLCLLFVQ